MNGDAHPLESIAARCLDLIEQGATINECLGLYAEQAAQLRPILEIAAELREVQSPPLSVAQLDSMQTAIARKLTPRMATRGGKSLGSRPWILALTVTAVVLIAVGIVVLNTDESDETVPVSAIALTTAPPRETSARQPEPTSTMTSLPPTESPTSTPTVMPTVEPTLEAEEREDEAALPVFVDVTGQVESFDPATGQLIIEGLEVVLSEEILPATRDLATGSAVTISGTLQDDGTLLADIVEPAEDDADTSCTSASGERCHPVLAILAEAYQVPYDELDALKTEGFGVGELARLYLLAEETGQDVTMLIALRREQMSWGDIIQSAPDLDPDSLAQGVIVGNGKGRTIRDTSNGKPVHPGSSGNQGRGRGQGRDRSDDSPGRGGGNGPENDNRSSNDKDK